MGCRVWGLGFRDLVFRALNQGVFRNQGVKKPMQPLKAFVKTRAAPVLYGLQHVDLQNLIHETHSTLCSL